MIIYFSGTGNSFSLAQKLGERINERVLPLKKAINNGDENIIFVFPLYCEDIPPHVRNFLKSFVIDSNQKIMAICTSGGGIGNAEYTFNKIMASKGHKVAKFLSAPMIDNSFPVLFGGELNKRYIDEDEIINNFIHMSYNNRSTFNPVHKVTEILAYNPISKLFLTKKVDLALCIGCGMCEHICQNDNIQVINKVSKIHKECTECFGCVHVCPMQSIRIRQKLHKRNQYTNKY